MKPGVAGNLFRASRNRKEVSLVFSPAARLLQCSGFLGSQEQVHSAKVTVRRTDEEMPAGVLNA
jgi:hypothetical protein